VQTQRVNMPTTSDESAKTLYNPTHDFYQFLLGRNAISEAAGGSFVSTMAGFISLCDDK
jgi:hypothetical protein